MDDLKKMIERSVWPFLEFHGEIRPISDLKCIRFYTWHKKIKLCFSSYKDEYEYEFDTEEESIKGKELLVSFLAQHYHPNNNRILDKIAELKEMIKCLPGIGLDYLEAKKDFEEKK